MRFRSSYVFISLVYYIEVVELDAKTAHKYLFWLALLRPISHYSSEYCILFTLNLAFVDTVSAATLLIGCWRLIDFSITKLYSGANKQTTSNTDRRIYLFIYVWSCSCFVFRSMPIFLNHHHHIHVVLYLCHIKPPINLSARDNFVHFLFHIFYWLASEQIIIFI